ncbi:MAG: glutamate racemase [Fusobacteria bacterium]|nr:glutamate racemase [Fusobacteriota bacterium]
MDNRGIGVFDSGVGGLTVCSSLHKMLPQEDIYYFGDLAHVPYGNKSQKLIQHYSMQISKFLIEKNIKLLVIACNTATAYALEYLKENLNIPVIGVVEPGSKEAIRVSKSRNIGIIGTLGTVNSEAYINSIYALDHQVRLYQQACPLFVPIIEEGILEGKIAEEIILHYLSDISKEVDTIVLGCTHYPLLKKTIAKIINKNITYVDSAQVVAQTVFWQLKESQMLNSKVEGKLEFYVSDSPKMFRNFLKLLEFEDSRYTIHEVNLEN